MQERGGSRVNTIPMRGNGVRRSGPGGLLKRLASLVPLGALVLLAPGLLLRCGGGAELSELERIAGANRPVFKGEPVSEETRRAVAEVLDEYGRMIQERVRDREELGVLYKKVAMKYLEIDVLKLQIAELLTRPEGRDASEAPVDLEEEGIYQEALALGLMDRGIYRDALIHLERAIEIFPENEILYYYAGVCAAKMGKTRIGPAESLERREWYGRAEEYYGRALVLQPEYGDALYALSILLVYELDRAAEAQPLLERLTSVETRNTDALFLLARVYYITGQLDRAVREYERIEEVSTVREKIERARSNRDRVLEEMREEG